MRNAHSALVGVPDAPRAPAAAALAITRAWPTMASSELHVAFVLAARGEATFELFDLGGRRLARENLGILEPGAQQRVVHIGDRVPAGVIWLRLQGAASAVTKAIVAR